MRLQRSVPMLAAIAALAAGAAPAQAFDNRAPEPGPTLVSHSAGTGSSGVGVEIGAGVGLAAAAAIGVGGYAAGRRSARVNRRAGGVVAGRS
jgi:hypothetical protein